MNKFISILIVLFISSVAAAGLGSRPGILIATKDSTSCFPDKLVGFIEEVRGHFGKIEIASGNRGKADNRRRGGARRSLHTHCKAVDFRVPGVPKQEVRNYLTANFSGRAGIGYYCKDRFHLDVGNPRQWGGCQPSAKQAAAAKRNYRKKQTAPAANQPRSNWGPNGWVAI